MRRYAGLALGAVFLTLIVAVASFETGSQRGGGQVRQPLGSGETVFERRIGDSALAITQHPADNALCADTGGGQACTTLDSAVPMVTTGKLGDGQFVVSVIDPQQRIASITVYAADAQFSAATSNEGLSAEVVLSEPPDRVVAIDAAGLVLANAAPDLEGEERRAREDLDASPEP